MTTPRSGDRFDIHGNENARTIIGQQNNEHHLRLPRQEIDWPLRSGNIPEAAAHYQHRNVADQIDQDLHSFGTVILRQVLSGTGGVGKTQLAGHHARALRAITDPDHRVDLLIWANAATRTGVTTAYAHAARQLFTTLPDDPEHTARLLLSWLSDPNQHRNRRWLIVWDDLADPAQVTDLWPPHDQPHGRTLVTTRRRDHTLTTQGRHLIEVGVYTAQEARTFLTNALNEAGITHTRTELDALANALGRLPLALGQAVPYMAELGLDCNGYLEVFHDRMHTLSEVFPDWDGDAPLAATWDLSLERADTFHPPGLARPLMGLLSLLDGEGIPLPVLTAPSARDYLTAARTKDKDTGGEGGATTAPGVSDHQVRAALAALFRLNLTTRTPLSSVAKNPGPGGDGVLVHIHQLVQRATREHPATRPTPESARATADALLDVWPEVERDTGLGARLRAHTRALRTRTISGHSVEEWLWQPDGHPLLFRAGRSLGESGQVGAAVGYWQEMARTAGHRLGPDHPDTLTTRQDLASWRGETGDPEGATHAFETLLTDQLRALGPDHPDTLTTRNYLAYWRGEAGDPEGATHAFETLLTDQLRALGPDHIHTLTTRHNLASWRGKAGDPEGATHAFETLLTDLLRILGPDHPDTLTTRHNLAYWRGEAGDPEGATHAFETLLTDQLRILGPDHPHTLTTRANLASWRGKTGDPEGATHAFETLLTDQLRILGPDHPHTLTTRNHLAVWTYESGDTTKAIGLLSTLVHDKGQILDPDHPDTQTAKELLQRWRDELDG